MTDANIIALNLMNRMDELLTEAGFVHKYVNDDDEFKQIYVPWRGCFDNGWRYWIICHPNSRGFPNKLKLGWKDEDKFKMEGWLTPEEALKFIKKMSIKTNGKKHVIEFYKNGRWKENDCN